MSMAFDGGGRWFARSACGDGDCCFSTPGELVRFLCGEDLNDDMRRISRDVRESLLSSGLDPTSPLPLSSNRDCEDVRLFEIGEAVVSVELRLELLGEKVLCRSSATLSDDTCSGFCVSEESCFTIKGLR